MSVQAMSWVFEHSKAKKSERLVLLSIANHMDPDGEGWVHVARICAEANITENTYRKAVQALEDSGELIREVKAGGSPKCHDSRRPNWFIMPMLDPSDPPSLGGSDPISFGGSPPPPFWGVERDVSKEPSKGGPTPTVPVDADPLTDDDNQLVLVTEVEPATRKEAVHQVALRVYQAWIAATGRNPRRTQLTKTRENAVRKRLNEGFTEQDLIEAVKGIGLSRWNNGHNDGGKFWNDMELALRDDEHVERYQGIFLNGDSDDPERLLNKVLAEMEFDDEG